MLRSKLWCNMSLYLDWNLKGNGGAHYNRENSTTKFLLSMRTLYTTLLASWHNVWSCEQYLYLTSIFVANVRNVGSAMSLVEPRLLILFIISPVLSLSNIISRHETEYRCLEYHNTNTGETNFASLMCITVFLFNIRYDLYRFLHTRQQQQQQQQR